MRPARTQPDKPITANVLCELLQTNAPGLEMKVIGDLKMPRSADLKNLARILENWRRRFKNEEIAKQRSKLQKTAMDALETAKDAMSRLLKIDRDREILVAGPKSDSQTADALAKVECALRSPGICNATIYEGRCADWMLLIDALPEDFAIAMKCANPTFNRRKISETAPVARYIAAVVPLITGEHPTVASVATQLKTHMGRGRKQ
jgi:hypothetical protein